MTYLCLIPTGIIVCAVGVSAMGFFRKMEEENEENDLGSLCRRIYQ